MTKVTSFMMIVIGILMGTEAFDLREDKNSFVSLLNIGNGALAVLVPVYLGAFFPKLRAPEVFLAMVANLLTVIGFTFTRMWPSGAFKTHCRDGACDADGNPHGGVSRWDLHLPPPLGEGHPGELYLWFLPAFWSLLVSMVVLVVAHFIFSSDLRIEEAFYNLQGISPTELMRFGKERLDQDHEGKLIKKFASHLASEPITNPKAWPFVFFPFIACLGLPWWGYGKQQFEWLPIVAGMPDWAFDFSFINATGTASLMISCAFFWKACPEHEKEMAKWANIPKPDKLGKKVDEGGQALTGGYMHSSMNNSDVGGGTEFANPLAEPAQSEPQEPEDSVQEDSAKQSSFSTGTIGEETSAQSQGFANPLSNDVRS